MPKHTRHSLVALFIVALAYGATLAASSANTPSPSMRMELFVTDMEKSVDFYTTILGFTKERGDSGYTVVNRGSITLGLSAAKGLSPTHFFNPEIQTQRRGLGVEIVFEVEDIEAEYNRIKATPSPLLSKLKKQPWGLSDFRLTDPDGYYIRLTNREK